ncbi:MAG TPA: DegT/DnrJ/EryC1/StrS family aminotransferase [Candidatus Udaeobacter sp.]|jgi:hypothetical protein|nr:DegT/DnrJ/EryC1/StrS family aminotransferase [Candidatus Udaeobacter sp.]
MLISMVDLKLQYREIADELQQGFARLFEKTAFIVGGEVASFEREFAQFSGVKHCVGVANGTDALEMMLRAVSVGAGDEVIVPANSFVASAFAVIRAGAVPKFVDSEPDTRLIDVQRSRGRSPAVRKSSWRYTSTARWRRWRTLRLLPIRPARCYSMYPGPLRHAWLSCFFPTLRRHRVI